MMMRTKALALIAALGLCGCATAGNDGDDPQTWGRVDCKRAADHPELMPEFEQAKAVCFNLASANAAAASANTQGLAGAVTAMQVNSGTAESCMAQRGFLLKRKSEHNAMCAAASAKPTAKPQQQSSAR
ncbi:hypothetical protein [Xanthobacter oligotrophicus]|uniref:hypothetical protein n=1 Tax=Xanthobacter oligotrophicus TaxID=2607286 RepID=UPI0011F11540|nr:hypothetical protein [Xanthobacter oligotrophicus]MCG5237114.1 hypothetical protein [Xanthobacter oligotrophicus]